MELHKVKSLPHIISLRGPSMENQNLEDENLEN